MELLIKKFVFLLLFATLLFLVARLLEFIAWYETGLLMMKLVDPFSLSVKKLKSLLDGRGLSYEGVVDKAELTDLVQASGDVVEGEVLMLEQESTAEEEEVTTTFSSKTRFFEEVEDKKDSVWLIQVVPRNHGPLLGRRAWATVVKKLSRFGIRPGLLDCSVDPRICARKNWNLPLLLLAMPQGHRHKDHVTMATFTSVGKAHQIIKWVNSQLAGKVKSIHHAGLDDDIWKQLKSEQQDIAAKVFLFSKSREPPMFFSALNLKYSGRIKFGFISIDKDASSNLPSDFHPAHHKYPFYVVVTPEGKRIYGRNVGEYCTYKAMDIYLRTLTPEANDIFILSFTSINAICLMGLFVVQGGIAKRICSFLWALGKYNIIFILLFIPVLGISQLSFMEPVLNFCCKVIRLTSQTWLMGKVRQDWLMYSHHVTFVIVSFFLYSIGVNWTSKRFHSPSQADTMTSSMWLRSSLLYYHNLLLRPSTHFEGGRFNNGHLEEGLDVFLEHMAVPDLWLHPVIPPNYINELLTWKYSCDWLQNRHSSCEEESCDSEKNHFRSKTHKKRCPKLRCLHRSRLDCRSKIRGDSWVHDVCPNDGPELGDSNIFVVKSGDEKPICNQPISSIPQSRYLHSKKGGIKYSKSEEGNVPKSLGQIEWDDVASKSDENVDTHGKDPKMKFEFQCRCMEEHSVPPDLTTNNNIKSSLSDTHLPTNPNPEANQGACNHHIQNKEDTFRCADKPTSKPATKPDFDPWPEGMLYDAKCAICLESYTHGVTVCGLPCGHAFHQKCIGEWLTNGKHACPICRWPAYKKKGCKLSKHME